MLLKQAFKVPANRRREEMMTNDNTTHFGFQRVGRDTKGKKVAAVFDSVADRYDVMNDLMSFGIHRWWKRFTVEIAALQPGHRVLDLAAGTCDLTGLMSDRVGTNGQIVASDINISMLSRGRARLVDRGIVGNIDYVQADAEQLPFPDNYFDRITIAFGLRNVTEIGTALTSMYRTLKAGGRLLILEFSHVTLKPLRPLYDAYSFKLLPLMGRIVAGDEASYRYLAESIRMHPDQKTLKNMILETGFGDCDYLNLTGGVVAVHRAFKY